MGGQILGSITNQQNSKAGFRRRKIWPFNPKIMENKTPPTKVYASRNSNGGQQGEYHYSSDDQTNHNHLKEEEFAIALLINITIIYS